ncbi:hypothetical protein ADK60_27465 [Streptomyces sp. XY431]|uniref:hypothetical protein n=1 Tax=Streptomyces sp. XY431 TaxID=1415562 RepID=UPI0006AE1759|nr:hypothetical protein [Streptomyces sp. XY431]KOV17081.1 hypothetical protein ADK60_27465 [Streptomyces sp. XY431]
MTAPGTVAPEPGADGAAPDGPGADGPPADGPLADEPATPSTTARTLRRLRGALVAGSLLTGALCLVASSQAHTGTDAIGERAAPAVLRAEAAYGALADAQRVAVHGFQQGTVVLGGLGDDYRNDIAAINQNLAELAGDNVAGPASASDLQLVAGLVVNYNAELEQAAADYQQTGDLTRALPALWYATLQYREVSATLDRLRKEENAALTARRDSRWLAGAADLLFLVPFTLVLVLFARTQVVLRRRFRRRSNILLTAALLALAATALLCGLSLRVSDGRLGSALDGPFAEAVTLAQQQASRSAARADADLYAVLAQECPAAGSCGTHLAPPTSGPATVGTGQTGHQQAEAENAFTSGASEADAYSAVLPALLVLLTSAAATAAALALNPRIDEYRFGGQ